ncbi:ribosome maturation factor RimM [Rhodoferax aquaticus]|uniref:Ribosome maturation factor RimM n=1 Tax=Rhodoferax aquaticus TaxID=2527691 RepID=A0A515ERT8_9BURK|nr:ribosome maturation factor RimM [Rhodoferax aquaticus]QDL55374.1 ribosome maturation factor RimM [Rhodoferax aquaticus]
MLIGLEPAELPNDAIEVGRVADAWGIKGWFKVLPYSNDPEALFSSKRWFLLPAEKGAKNFTGVALLTVAETKVHSDSVVASAHKVLDRNAAEALRGARIFISRANFPAAQKDEFYWVDLLGLNVVNREGVALGVVKDLLSTGPQTVLVIEFELDGKAQERMIPFVSVYVDDVDLPGKRILVDWQADF